jgi:hypothetical protein
MYLLLCHQGFSRLDTVCTATMSIKRGCGCGYAAAAIQATLDDIKVSQLSGAMTNLIYRCRYQRGAEVTTAWCNGIALPCVHWSMVQRPQERRVHTAGSKRADHSLLQKLFALARVFGNIPDDLFSRSYEAMIFRTVARAGMGPKLLVGAAAGHGTFAADCASGL